jgi:hydroxymethylglutaryl-CoA reductase (NADPH)
VRKVYIFSGLKGAFESMTSLRKLEDVAVIVVGRNAYIRFRCFAGEAMGKNMISKGSLSVIDYLKDQFPSLDLLALSGNMCMKKGCFCQLD